jgi:hypothetical protein
MADFVSRLQRSGAWKGGVPGPASPRPASWPETIPTQAGIFRAFSALGFGWGHTWACIAPASELAGTIPTQAGIFRAFSA